MGVGVQDLLGGHQTFAQKMTWFSQIGYETVFCLQSNSDLQKKKVFTEIETLFLSKVR